MGNLKRPSKKDHVQCKKHPKHKQSPGICSLCLNEKLSKVVKTRSLPTRMRSSSYSSSSLSSEYSSSSSSSSSYSSPMHHRRRSGDDSSSDDYKKKTTRRGGYWSKLLHPTRKKIDNGDLVHSSTMRERIIEVS